MTSLTFHRRALLAVFVVVLSITNSTHAQTPYFQEYHLAGKNEPLQFNAIHRDQTGFTWFGTNKGLFKYDGITTTRFGRADSLAEDYVSAVAEDSLHRIWVGHRSGKITYLDKDGFHHFITKEGDATAEVSDILFDKQGTMWFSTKNDGLYYFKNERVYRIDDTNGLPDLFVYDIELDDDGSIWAGTDGGVAICTVTDNKASVKVLNYDNGLPDNIVKKVMKGRDGKWWLAAEDAGVFSYDPRSQKFEPLTGDTWTAGAVTDFLLLGNDCWISTATNGVFVFNLNEKKLISYRAALSTGSVNRLLADPEGNIWVGTRNSLSRSLGRRIQYIDQPAGSSDPNVLALTVDKEGNIWFATSNGLYKRANSITGVVLTQPLAKTKFESFNVISLYTDNDGYVWAGFYGQGVVRISRSGAVKHLSRELTNGSILNISGKDHHIWLSTLNGTSRITANGESLAIENFGHEQDLSGDYIYQTFVDSKNRVWFASDREGVDMLDKGSVSHFTDSIAAKAIYGFAEDGKGNIWANVQNEGLFKFNGTGFLPFKALSNLNINSLSSDANGNIIAIHDLGIDIVHPDGTIAHLDNEVGFGERVPNLNSTCKDSYGNIYVGTETGILLYSPEVQPDTLKPSALVDRLIIFGKSHEMSENMKLAYNENNLTFRLVSFWYQHPDGVSFQYRLENYDQDWIQTGDRSVVFSALPPGEYKLRVRASATDNFEGAGESVFAFVVRPPFWRTTVFYLLATLAFVLLASAYIQRRLRRLRNEKQILEKRVSERTAEIVKKNEEIQAQAEEIRAINESLERRVEERTFELERKNKSLEEYAFITAHNLRSPVASVLGLINLMLHSRLGEDQKEIVDHLRISAERLDSVVHTITESIERSDQLEAFENPTDKGMD